MSRAALIAVAALTAAAPAWAEAPAFGPFGSRRHAVTRDADFHARAAAVREPRGETFLRVPYEFYRTVVSPIDGASCIHRPTCSRYALDAVRKHQILGLLLAIDRLWRSADSSAVRRLPLVLTEDGFFFLDPLEDSDFWLRPPSSH